MVTFSVLNFRVVLKLGWNLRGKFEKFFVLDYTTYLDYGPGSSAQKSKYGYAYDQFMKEAQKIKPRFFFYKRTSRDTSSRDSLLNFKFIFIFQSVRDGTDQVGRNQRFSPPALPNSDIFSLFRSYHLHEIFEISRFFMKILKYQDFYENLKYYESSWKIQMINIFQANFYIKFFCWLKLFIENFQKIKNFSK